MVVAFTGGMRLYQLALAAVVALLPLSARAQSPAEQRMVAFGDIGIAKTADDEGVLGTGMSLSSGIGVRLTERLTVQAILERIGYDRNLDYLRIEGRVIFTGVEASWLWKPGRVHPFVTVGAGFFNDDSTWTSRSRIPFGPTTEDVSEHHYTLAAMTSSTGFEVAASKHASVRAAFRFHGLLDTGDDLAPHMMIQGSIGVAWRW